MSEQQINEALELILKNKVARNELNIDKRYAYDLRHRLSVSAKLEVLWRANKLQLKDEFTE
ncbi:hypothetical protein JJL45_05135 [Tamlana sp. s12]|uniref:hypothetical protein n=1 Tax=Tamlana sp. s12 TaxID=1630406 RepID=UPI0007FC5221|nr:hypothetical protein [Tamlana sp. s12]OBQ56112.1 hypothetical protein VQ01_06925 [Tamlana sp. s12]QQY83375.1 hypothetical protein JJL45_05135 [Tamlana sp. s12]